MATAGLRVGHVAHSEPWRAHGILIIVFGMKIPVFHMGPETENVRAAAVPVSLTHRLRPVQLKIYEMNLRDGELRLQQEIYVTDLIRVTVQQETDGSLGLDPMRKV